MKIKLTKYHLLTIASISLFIGFWFGFFVFAEVRVKIVCQPSGRVLIDTTRSLRKELTLNVNVIGCESIDFVIRKPTIGELIFGRRERAEEPELLENKTKSVGVPSPPEKVKKGEEEVEGTFIGGGIGSKTEPSNASTVLTLEIFDACSIEVSTYSQLIEGMEWCINKKYPYNIVLRKNQTHLTLGFYDEPFTETYELNESVQTLRFFVRDVTTVTGDIVSVGIYGDMDRYFSVGEFSIDNVWERDHDTGVLKLAKTVLSFPLIVSKDIPYTDNWSELKLYLNLTQGVYFIGNSYIYVTSM